MQPSNDATELNGILARIDAIMHTQPDEALKLCEQVFADATRLREPLAYVIAAEHYGNIMDHLGRATESRNILSTAQQIAQSALLFINEARLLEQLARTYYSTSEHRQALQYWARSLELSELGGRDPRTWILAKVGLAQVYFGVGDYASGLTLLREAGARMPEVEDPHLDAKIKINCGVSLVELNRPDEATPEFLQALELCTKYHLLDYAAESNFYLGKIELARNALDAAAAYLHAALDMARPINYQWGESNILATQAEVYAKRADYARAIKVVREAQAIAISNNFLHMLIKQHLAAASYAEAMGDFQTGLSEYKAARICEKKVMEGTSGERNKELEEKAGLRPSVNRLLVELSNNRMIYEGELEPAFQLIARESSHILPTSRTSLWLLDPQSDMLVCRCLYLTDLNEFSKEEPLHRKKYPLYFERLADSQALAAHDALHHPHTTELEQSYLQKHDIKSLLAVPIRLAGKTIGILCFENVGVQHNWTPDDILRGAQLSEVSARVVAGFEHKMHEEQIGTLNARVMAANEMLEQRVIEQTVSLERHTNDLHAMQNQLSELREKLKEQETALPADKAVKRKASRSAPAAPELSREGNDERLRNLIQLSCDWTWEQDDQFRLTYVDELAQEKIGLRSEFMRGKRYWDFPSSNLTESDWIRHREMLESHQPFIDLELHLLDSGNGSHWISLSGQPVFDADGRFTGYRGIGREITSRKDNEDRIRFSANHDVLTSLPNRSLFSEFLARSILAGKRYDRRFAVVFLDLDRFKVINDTLGHEAGDTLLKVISGRLQKCLRTSDVVARLGGDEFVILLQEIEVQEQAGAVANKILASVISPVTLLGQECRVTASIGICMYTGEEDEQMMMKNADIAMYRAKEDGKNTFRFYSEGIKTQSLERMILENNLRRAVEFKQFYLQYQAKLDLKKGTITGVEALVRWKHPELGHVQPLQFIPLAEETGLIVPIGRWVLQEACRQNVAWQQAGVAPLSMAVNLSSRQFVDISLLSDIEQALRDSGMDPKLLELELTESMVVQNFELASKLLASIKSLGVKLAIDDFGTGYSSLSQLKNFPIDTLKVDRSFIRDLPENVEDRAITRAIIDMGRTLNLTVVAEGVETADQEAFLRDSHCSEIQGYHFSKPIEPDQFLKLWQDHATK